jgi:glycosyltransferase involved in cell wall biosynthesis
MADAFVAPSRWDAGPVALMEAMGAGLPVITSTAINPAEQLAEKYLAYLCPLMPSEVARAMNIVMGDEALRQELGARGQAWVKQECSPAVVGQALARFYDRALAGDAGGPSAGTNRSASIAISPSFQSR